MTEPTRQRARGLDRAFDILDHLKRVGRPLRPNEIAAGLGIPKSTVYDLVGLLLERHMLDAVGRDGQVYLGRELYFLGQAHLRHFDLAREAGLLLDDIVAQTRETAQLCQLNGRKYTVSLMKEGARAFRISSNVGEDAPIPWTASGRLLLGHLSDAEILALIDPDDFILPDGSRLDPATFIAEIRSACAAGFFSFDSIADTYTHCFAAPVQDASGLSIATLCIVAPRADAQAHHAEYRQVLVDSARRLSQRLGGQENP
ncbi:IclR family transcriptional regulator [Pseudomonas sp. 102515]|uniref:IclR family transcriptional regulator n=1 Tax=Pseudomonas sp. 102515 TaxID=3071568 RepID=UPI002801A4FF|nr:IclR family transcriptional regulator [Pseudomonas sp. 102515]MDQ7915224.1 IclR family transcriptional regulator [Pseudomonas sp. 102515]